MNDGAEENAIRRAYINVIAKALEGEDSCFPTYVAKYYMGLDAQHSFTAECHRCWLPVVLAGLVIFGAL
jgi:hypothetical protein